MTDVVSLGEALVDFLPSKRGARVREVAQWTPCLGGAPANVAVGLRRLGARSAIVGVTGDDEFGHFLRDGLRKEGVDVRFMRQTREGKTGLGFVSLTRDGERSFTFYRERAAETFLCSTDTKGARKLLDASKVVHVGTNSLIHPEAREAVLEAMQRAHARGQITSTDPNLRLHLWKDPSILKRLLATLFSSCAIVKLSEEEIEFVTGSSNVSKALRWLEKKGVLIPIVTRGEKGASFSFNGERREVPARRVKVIDTTGAGDGFTAGFLYGVTRLYGTRAELDAADLDALEGHARFGCLVGSHVVTRLGAVAGLPRLGQLAKRGARP
ncbi:MAG: carbohydrate kinase [Archangium sp.]|nr:carbohydrate kinase [Archangium sp.]